MRILVTGGAGFIGSHLVDELLQQGHQVAVVDNLETGKRENINPNAKFYLADICNRELLENIFSQFKPHVVNHHAAQMSVVRSVKEPLFDAQVNIVGTLNMINLCTAYEVRRFIFASTGGAIYGDLERFPADEDHPTRPLSPYGVSKRTAELYLGVYSKINNLPFTIFRYPNVFGPRQSARGEAGVVAIFSQMLLKGKRPRIFGDGSKTRDYVYVHDIIRANLLALDKNLDGIFNLGSGVEVTDIEIFKAVGQASSTALNPIYDQVRQGEVYRVVLDASRFRAISGWEPQVELNLGVQKSVDFYRNHPDW